MVKAGGLVASAVLALAISVWLESSAEARHRKYARQFRHVPPFRDVRQYQDDNFLQSREDERRSHGAFAGIVIELIHSCSREAAELDRLPSMRSCRPHTPTTPSEPRSTNCAKLRRRP
jgi:hypothetical protein